MNLNAFNLYKAKNHSNRETSQVANLENSYEIIDEFLTYKQLHTIKHDIQSACFPAKAGGLRNAEKIFSSIQHLAQSDYLHQQAETYLKKPAKLVRAMLFNKTIHNNWLVAWHQDRTVTVSKKFVKNGWGPWSIKDNIIHVQPPLDVLNQMVSIRIFIDDSTVDNGCLKVLPKSHTLGILGHDAIQEYIKNHKPIYCEGKAGSALVMCPHILHSSSKASHPSQRRILHLEYNSFTLPSGIEWA